MKKLVIVLFVSFAATVCMFSCESTTTNVIAPENDTVSVSEDSAESVPVVKEDTTVKDTVKKTK